ncbi:acyl-CoA thioesterase [Paracraurococcus lichenis]|uniref:Thioesterase family protein n=1 Tax=Paracraurococcus lichenis TaxID=3064888 RepID=A0ABT9DUG3_9PROT|nr:thioesterase family protein [Paracraurococcus sp. LOR1-02]MDO9707523.1 thioesterase family protein [Paracraurococcus sp. LOR1-02]
MPDTPSTLDDFAFAHRLRVRWAELDPQRIVFNANYLMYFDVALSEYLRAIDFKGQQGFAGHGSNLVAAKAELDFRAPARHDDELLVTARVATLGRTSLRFRMGCFRDEALLVEGRLAYVNVTLGDHRPVPLPAPFVEKVLAFERIPPERTAPG